MTSHKIDPLCHNKMGVLYFHLHTFCHKFNNPYPYLRDVIYKCPLKHVFYNVKSSIALKYNNEGQAGGVRVHS